MKSNVNLFYFLLESAFSFVTDLMLMDEGKHCLEISMFGLDRERKIERDAWVERMGEGGRVR